MIFRSVNAVASIICLAFLLSCTEPLDGSLPNSFVSNAKEPPYSVEGITAQPNGDGGSVSPLTTVRGDLNADGYEDLATIVVHDSVGSGVFYYLNVFVADGDGGLRLVGEEFLGDRLKSDLLDIYSEGSVSSNTGIPIHPDDYGMLIAAYFTHTNDQSFAEEPTLYITKHWRVLNDLLVQIEDY